MTAKQAKPRVASSAKGKKRPLRRLDRPAPKRSKVSLSVGDEVRVPAGAPNLFSRYTLPTGSWQRSAPLIQGIICSIRHLPTGRLVAKTTLAINQYVLEVLHDQSFQEGFASAGNAASAGRPSDRITQNPLWQRVRQSLADLAAQGQLVSQAAGTLYSSPVASLLDGWRVVKVWAEQIEPAE